MQSHIDEEDEVIDIAEGEVLGLRWCACAVAERAHWESYGMQTIHSSPDLQITLLTATRRTSVKMATLGMREKGRTKTCWTRVYTASADTMVRHPLSYVTSRAITCEGCTHVKSFLNAAGPVYAVAWNPQRENVVASGGGDDKAFLWKVLVPGQHLPVRQIQAN